MRAHVQLDDEPSMTLAQKDLDHFEHNFKGALHTASGARFTETFGACKFEKRPVSIVCKGTGMDIIEDVGISSNKKVEIRYVDVSTSLRQLKITVVSQYRVVERS